MKRKNVIRWVLVTACFVFTAIVYQRPTVQHHAEEQSADVLPVVLKKRSASEFLIWESISRYIMAGYH